MARVPCDLRFLLIPAAFMFIYIQMRLFQTQSQYADRLSSALESENHCTSQLRSLIDQVSTKQSRILALEDLKNRQDQQLVQLKDLVHTFESKGIAKLTEGGQVPLAAVVIMACSRADYLERTVNSVLKSDGSNQAVKSKSLTYTQLTYMQHLDFEPVITERPGELIAYYKIARHYKWALDQLFYKHKFSRVIILEDDMEIAPDFFDYFEAAARLMDRDDLVSPHMTVHFFVKNVGSSLGQFFSQYLEPIKLNDVKVDWNAMDLGYLTEGNYTKYFSGLVRQARPIQGSDLVLKAQNINGDVRIRYEDQAEFERIAGEFGIFEEWKDTMKHSGGNQACFVLGQKTPSIRDLYSLGHKLGQGQFGTTYMCREISTGREYACKSITKRKLISKEDVEDVRREIQIMHHLAGYKNIVTIKGAYEDPLYVHIVMELCSGGELFDRIIQRGHYSERKAAELIKIIVGVVEACHSLGVMHRDLKPENFLLVNKDDDFSLKAIDFGLSVFFKPGQIFEDVVGSPYYVAPEVLLKHYGPEADVWTAGVILYILVSGVPPFWAETQQGIFDAVLKGHIDFDSDPWPLISDSAKDLIRGMLCSRPSERLTAHQVLRHPWICENGVAPDRALDPAVLSRLKQFSAMNKLKQMALRVIAESLSEEEIAGLKEMFKAMDTDNSGAITFDELKAGLRRYGSTLKDTEIRDLMEAADIDKSGTIDYGEFIAATIHLNKLDREEHLLSAFSYFDKDGSGYITIDELQQACAEQGMSDVFLEDVIKEVDQDNVRYQNISTGLEIIWSKAKGSFSSASLFQDGRIDYGEFVAMMQKGIAGRTMRKSINMSVRNNA
ncbi:hypothetical protein YC2023_088430 [Brassica napus]